MLLPLRRLAQALRPGSGAMRTAEATSAHFETTQRGGELGRRRQDSNGSVTLLPRGGFDACWGLEVSRAAHCSFRESPRRKTVEQRRDKKERYFAKKRGPIPGLRAPGLTRQRRVTATA